MSHPKGGSWSADSHYFRREKYAWSGSVGKIMFTRVENISEDSNDTGHMQKEAIQKHSNITRDKDVEIDALKQKNVTLLTIIQDSSQNGP